MKQQQFKRFVPILAYEKISQSDYKRKDDLYCIIDLLFRKQLAFKSETQKLYGYVELPKSVIKTLIADSNSAMSALNYLKDNNIIKANEHYLPEKFAKSYKITKEFLSKKCEVTIIDKNINKRIEAIENERRKFFEKKLEITQLSYYESFNIDYDAAYQYLYNKAKKEIQILGLSCGIKLDDAKLDAIVDTKGNYKQLLNLFGVKLKIKELQNIMYRFITNHYKILCIKNGYLYFKRNDTNGRLDTNLTNLQSDLRQFLTSTEVLYSIDIKNSQPYFLYCLLKSEKAISSTELERYGQIVVEGRFYEFLIEKYEEKFGTIPRMTEVEKRKYIKKLLFRIYFSKVQSEQRIKTFFGSVFPEIMEYINKTNKESNSILSNKLSTAESTIIISTILPKLAKKYDIKPFTIHDSFVCKESELETIINVFKETLTTSYDIVPSLHIKTLIDDSRESTTVEEEITYTDDDYPNNTNYMDDLENELND